MGLDALGAAEQRMREREAQQQWNELLQKSGRPDLAAIWEHRKKAAGG